MIDAKSHVQHLAVTDAASLAEDFERMPARQWEGLAHGSWLRAVEEVGLTDREQKDLYGFYLRHLVMECGRIVDARVAVRLSCPRCGERDHDNLTWVDDETVRCVCGMAYAPGLAGRN